MLAPGAENAAITTDDLEFILVPQPSAALLLGLGLLALHRRRGGRV
ncbi:MAG: hypothetical protein GY910_07945 [bacterium]|nr:hypothetical protein [bacterium]